MATKKKLLQAAAGSAGGGAGALNVEDVFSTYLYEGNGDKQFIDNGINLGQANDGYSGYFGGSGYYVGAEQTQLTDFTVEGWFYFSNLGSNRSLFTLGYNDLQAYYRSASSNFAIYDGSSKTYSWTPSGSTWYHIAVVRSGSSVELFVDGVSKGTQTSSATISGDLIIGGYAGATDPMNGYISNIRVSDNVRYSSNFTAPTSALTTDANTTLLTLQDDTFIDNSGDGNVITPNGGAKMVSHAPFTAADAGEGGLVWIKQRGPETTSFHSLFDTERGDGARLVTNSSNAQNVNQAYYNTSFNSNGFTIGSGNDTGTNKTGSDYASWTFRKAPKFFTCLTYSGNGSTQTISHDLGSDVGMLIIKSTSAGNWFVWHRSLGDDAYLFLNGTNAEQNPGFDWIGVTSTTISLQNNSSNNNGETYIAYLFAHNDGDGEFGPTGDQDIIKCGSYTGTGSAGNFINLGFEPQWLLVKSATRSGQNWEVFDNMRGMPTGGNSAELFPNTSSAERSAFNIFNFTPTGFETVTTLDETNESGQTFIYIAIRRGPMAVPTDATEVFAMDTLGGTTPNPPAFNSGFPVDMGIYRLRTSTSNFILNSRLNQGKRLMTNATDAESDESAAQFDYMNGYYDSTSVSSDYIDWMWKRAPSFFDVVAYTGTGSARTVSHNLGVAPEMMWVKKRNETGAWPVYHVGAHSTSPENYFLQLNSTITATLNSARWNNTAPTATEFTVGNGGTVNDPNDTYIAYLFASLDGVSKVGSYTGDGNTGKQIDCGFQNGARFILIKATSSSGGWLLWDAERGIVTGNDPYLFLNTTDAENTAGDNVDPYSAGFIVNGPGNNASGVDYIFYAIA